MKKCDVIIPVYKSPEWVKLCVYSLFKNTKADYLENVYLINDCLDDYTINCLKNLEEKYSKIKIIQNEENLGFVKTCNKGLKMSKADYVLLLNTDCIITKNTISKLMNHCEANKNIGLICPISSNAANLSLEMFEGFSFMDMNDLLERKFKGKLFDACTVVGNCLMISKQCIDKVGYLDEIYGTGYGEETDYQFKAMECGFEAKVAIDTYVFHKSEASFGTSKEKQEKQQKNAKIFFDRWGEKYNALMEKYRENDPIEYIFENITEKDKKNNFKFLIYLIGFSQTAGGIHMATDMINYLSINNYPCNIVYSYFNSLEYSEIMLFKPIMIDNLEKHKFDCLVSTFNTTTYFMKSYSNKFNVPLVYFAQGYEGYFYNGREYGIAELSYKIADQVLTISNFLKDRYKKAFNVDSIAIPNGINYDLLHRKNKNKKAKTVTFMLRNDTLKGDFLLLDVIRGLINNCENININIMYNGENIYFPKFDKKSVVVNLYAGPFQRTKIGEILQTSDIFVDASLTEGFGLMALEAMAAGNVCVVSDSGGVREYLSDGNNGFIISNVLEIDEYISKIKSLLDDETLYSKIKEKASETAKKYDYDNVCIEYMNFFNGNIAKKKNILDDYDSKLYDKVLDVKYRTIDDNLDTSNYRKPKRTKKIIYKIFKIVPKGIRIKIKNGIAKLYHFTNER